MHERKTANLTLLNRSIPTSPRLSLGCYFITLNAGAEATSSAARTRSARHPDLKRLNGACDDHAQCLRRWDLLLVWQHMVQSSLRREWRVLQSNSRSITMPMIFASCKPVGARLIFLFPESTVPRLSSSPVFGTERRPRENAKGL